MPPKVKYSKEQIVQAALEVVSEKGAQALTAKELSIALKTSTSPIFTVFNSMQEVHGEVKSAALKRFESYADKAGQAIPVFKQIGMQMILFAKEEPELYKLIFMSGSRRAQSFEDIYKDLGAVADRCLNVIRADYGLTKKESETLFEHVWIHTFGIGTLCATGVCDFSGEQISQMLTQDFTAMMTLIKSKRDEG